MTQIIKVTEPILQIVERSNQPTLIVQTAPVQINTGSGGVTDGNKGDITVSGGGANWLINDSAKGRKKLNFSYGDVTTQVIYQAIAGQRITKVEIGFDVAFDVASSLKVGDGANIQRLMDTGQNNPLVPDIYSTHPFYKYASNTDILLTLVAGIGATQGSGTVIIYYE